MTTDNKAPDCSGCKWASENKGSPYSGGCLNGKAFFIKYRKERVEGDCGPSARYYEPKEQQP